MTNYREQLNEIDHYPELDYKSLHNLAEVLIDRVEALHEIVAHCTETARLYQAYLDTGKIPDEF
jgi:hypothetical protein